MFGAGKNTKVGNGTNADPEEMDPGNVMNCVNNAKLYFIMFLFFDITVVLNSIVQLWCLSSSSETALFIRHSAFGQNVNMALATGSVIVVGICFLWDSFLGSMLIHTLGEFKTQNVLKSNNWDTVCTLANANWYCNFATLLIWFAARLTVISLNPSWENVIGLGGVLLVRILKMRPMFTFRNCVNAVHGSSDKNHEQYGPQAFDMLQRNFGTAEDYTCLWKMAGASIVILVLIVLCFGIICALADSSENNAYGQEGDVVIPPIPPTPVMAVVTQQPIAQQQPLAQQPPPVQQPPVQGSLRRLESAPRQLKPASKDRVTIGDHIWYCHDYSLGLKDYECGSGYVGKHIVTHKGRDAFYQGVKTGVLAGGACAATAVGLDMTGYGIPAGVALGAACALGFGGGDGIRTFIQAIRDDDCIEQCDYDVPYEAKRDLWCIPYDHPEMMKCAHCDECQGCLSEDGLGFSFDVDQC